MITALRVIAASLFSTAAIAQTALPVMPLPLHAVRAPGEFVIDASFSMSTAGYRDAFLEKAAARLARNLSAKTGLALAGELVAETPSSRVRIHCKGAAAEPDESYTLTVTPRRVELRAAAPIGAMRGLATLFQLVRTTPAGSAIPSVTIEDRPRFAWRGLMIDVSRHFIPVEVLLREMDAMEAVKLNVLHLHLSDAQGFRVESKLFPKLQEAGSEGQFYSQDDVRTIAGYAQDRGIRVVPEFDVPGHTKSWLTGYPELASRPGADNTTATLDPSNERVYEFLDGLFGEMSALFPDPYFHVGGDEVAAAAWSQSPSIQAFMKQHGFKDKHELQAYFSGRVHEIVRKHGKTTIGWDEMLGGEIAGDVAIESWRSSKMTAKAAIAGHPAIVAAGYYLDWQMPAGFHYAFDPLDTAAYGLTPEQRELTKGHRLAEFFPEDTVVTSPVRLTAEQERRILGGEAAMWTELVTAERLDERIWPRMAAIAERFWSPRTVRDEDSMYERLTKVWHDLEVLGLKRTAEDKAMFDRLAPGAGATACLFAETLEPVKFYARRAQVMQGRAPALSLADVIPPESLAAEEFRREVRRLLSSRAGALTEERLALRAHVWADLTSWRDSADALGDTLPLTADVKALTEAGLRALIAWEQRQPPPPEQVAKQRALIEKHKQTAAASADLIHSFLRPQPPSGLLIAIVPAIEDLLNAAVQPGSRRR
jgi:hexosaminidase